MKSLKNYRKSIENKRSRFFLMGLIVALSASLLAFEFEVVSTANHTNTALTLENNFIEIEQIPVARLEKLEPPKPKTTPTTVIEISNEPIPATNDAPFDENLGPETPDNLPPVALIPEDVPEEAPVPYVVEEMPEFPGGETALFQFIQKNMRYPTQAKDAGIEGVVYLNFVVNEAGRITDINILKGIGGGCDEEAIRVLQNMPLWKPGMQGGRNVKVQFNMPLRFRLQ